MILICYDGSDDARAAIDHAATLLSGHPATVLSVWQPFTEVLVRHSYGFAVSSAGMDIVEIDRAAKARAQELAEEGAELARAAGFEATAATCSQETTVAAAILGQAAELDAQAIVMGSRGLTRVRSLLLGSVSSGVIQRADRTVVVVPSPEVASERGRALEAETRMD